MKDYIFIDMKDDQLIYGLVEDDKLIEYNIEDNKKQSYVGNIYRARVTRVVEGINAAFVDIGLKENGYLPFNKNTIYNKTILGDKLSEIKGGDSILVQVIKDPVENKGAYLSRDITFESNNIILTPFDKSIKLSKKITSKNDRYRLLDLGKNIIMDDLGFILRKNSVNVSIDKLKVEYLELIKEYKHVIKQKDFLPLPKLLYKKEEGYISFIRDLNHKHKYTLIYNNNEILKELKQRYLTEEFRFKKTKYLDEFNSKIQSTISKGLQDALKRSIRHENGAQIIIDELEAFTAIDVNSGGYTSSLSLEETKKNVNISIVPEIARQIRLRNLSGIILIDFLSTNNNINKKEIIEALNNEFRKDPNMPSIIGFTKLGLLEITRKRNKKSLKKIIMQTCSYCGGSGVLSKTKI